MADPAPSTLKQIPTAQVRLGMHVHALDGQWLDHPFWKTRFVLRDPADLKLLRNSRVPTLWINTALGLDLPAPGAGLAGIRQCAPLAQQAPAAAGGGRMAALGDAIGRPEAPPKASRAPAKTSMAEEMANAAKLVNRSRVAVSSMFAEARLGRALEPERCLPLVDEIADSVGRNPGAMVSLARLKTQDDYSYMHSVAVCALMVALGQELGLDEAGCREAGLAGLLHDLGKVAVPLEILNKPGKLTDEEFAIVRTHPVRGYEMLTEARGASEAAMDVCLHHHERADGRGYPHGLQGEVLSPLARMAAVCDVYDAITSNRPYKAGWDPAESIARMASWKGQFDDDVFRGFVRSLGIYPNGALVRLQSRRLALVIEQHPSALTEPVVKAFYDADRELPIKPVLIDLSSTGPGSGPDCIVDREPPGRWNFPQLNALWLGKELVKAKG